MTLPTPTTLCFELFLLLILSHLYANLVNIQSTLYCLLLSFHSITIASCECLLTLLAPYFVKVI